MNDYLPMPTNPTTYALSLMGLGFLPKQDQSAQRWTLVDDTRSVFVTGQFEGREIDFLPHDRVNIFSLDGGGMESKSFANPVEAVDHLLFGLNSPIVRIRLEKMGRCFAPTALDYEEGWLYRRLADLGFMASYIWLGRPVKAWVFGNTDTRSGLLVIGGMGIDASSLPENLDTIALLREYNDAGVDQGRTITAPLGRILEAITDTRANAANDAADLSYERAYEILALAEDNSKEEPTAFDEPGKTRTVGLLFKVEQSEADRIDALAEAMGMNRSRFLRYRSLLPVGPIPIGGSIANERLYAALGDALDIAEGIINDRGVNAVRRAKRTLKDLREIYEGSARPTKADAEKSVAATNEAGQ